MKAGALVLFTPLFLLAVTAACGDDDDESEADATTAPEETSPQTSAAVETVAPTSAPATSAPATSAPATTEPAPETTTAPAGPQEFVVMVDNSTDEFNGSFFGYFPDSLSVHPGDRIVYHSMYRGEPHSVALGDVVDDAVTGFLELTPEQQAGEAPPPPEVEAAFALIPAMLPDGPGDAIQTSVNPCFVAEGETIPMDPAVQCPVTEPAPFTGSEVFYNSGFLPDGETFVVELADDIAPGTYYAFCTLHFVEMISEITVVPADEPVQTPDEVLAEGQAQFEELAALGPPVIEEAEATATPRHVHAGLGSEESTKVFITEFVPGDVQVPVGKPVTFSIAGPHTVSFNAPESAHTILAKGDDGGFHVVQEALAPVGYEPPQGAPPPAVNGGRWNGKGFFSSGLLFEGDFVLRFDQPGTYEYMCLVHPGMQGTVTAQ